MNIAIASDHHGVKVKEKIIKYLEKKGYGVINYGTDNEAAVDYPEYAFKVGEAVADKTVNYGILICGTGIGMSIACNKINGARCGRITSAKEAELTKLHNHANVIAFSANLSILKIKDMIDTFLKTEYSQEERHVRRVEQINSYKSKK